MRNSVLLSCFWACTLFVMCAVQALPFSMAEFDTPLTEVIDYEETESDEKEKEQKEDVKLRVQGMTVIQDENQSPFISSFHFLNGFTIPPYSETLSPPPDQI